MSHTTLSSRVAPPRSALLLIAFALASCGGSNPEPVTGPPADSSGQESETTQAPQAAAHEVRTRSAEEIPTPPKPWAEMSPEERGHYMGQTVLPYMRELFQEYDPERYADFSCATCHGSQMHEVHFAMPNPEILVLPASGTPEQEQMVQDHPEMVRFMFGHVIPSMQQMLGQPDFDPATGEGFSCRTCHTSTES